MRSIASSTKRLLGLLVVASLAVVVYETLDLSWGYNFLDGTGALRSHETTNLFHLRAQESKNDSVVADGQSSARVQVNSSSTSQESSGSDDMNASQGPLGSKRMSMKFLTAKLLTVAAMKPRSITKMRIRMLRKSIRRICCT